MLLHITLPCDGEEVGFIPYHHHHHHHRLYYTGAVFSNTTLRYNSYDDDDFSRGFYPSGWQYLVSTWTEVITLIISSDYIKLKQGSE